MNKYKRKRPNMCKLIYTHYDGFFKETHKHSKQSNKKINTSINPNQFTSIYMCRAVLIRTVSFFLLSFFN